MLSRPKKKIPLYLYLYVANNAISFVLVQEENEGERSIYFINNVLEKDEVCYQKIERHTLAIIITYIHNYHYENNLWHPNNKLWSIFMVGQ